MSRKHLGVCDVCGKEAHLRKTENGYGLPDPHDETWYKVSIVKRSWLSDWIKEVCGVECLERLLRARADELTEDVTIGKERRAEAIQRHQRRARELAEESGLNPS